MKRILTLVLALALVIALSVSALAENPPYFRMLTQDTYWSVQFITPEGYSTPHLTTAMQIPRLCFCMMGFVRGLDLLKVLLGEVAALAI